MGRRPGDGWGEELNKLISSSTPKEEDVFQVPVSVLFSQDVVHSTALIIVPDLDLFHVFGQEETWQKWWLTHFHLATLSDAKSYHLPSCTHQECWSCWVLLFENPLGIEKKFSSYFLLFKMSLTFSISYSLVQKVWFNPMCECSVARFLPVLCH